MRFATLFSICLSPWFIWPVVILCFSVYLYFVIMRGKIFNRKEIVKNQFRKEKKYSMQTREEQIDRLENEEEFDMIVIGGGATGTGIALDASSRDGGVRYLQKAIAKWDAKEFEFVYDSLRERRHFFQISPHLCKKLRIITPCFTWYSALKNWILLKIYDVFGGVHRSVGPSQWWSKGRTLKLMPHVKNYKLKGSVVYHDCQFNDARFNVLLAMTSNALGGVALNHSKVVDLLKNDSGKAEGVTVQDLLDGKERKVFGKIVVNACGYMVDNIRQLDGQETANIISPSLGVHVVVDGKYAPPGAGVLVPVTTDKRVLFILNYENKCIVGTTEGPADLEPHPGPIPENIDMILKNMNMVFEKKVTKDEIISSWAGVRPLVRDPNVKNTAGLSRDHYISRSESGLLTICGGKYTTFRRMSHDCVEKAISLANLKPKRQSQSNFTVLVGSETITSSYVFRKKMKHRLKGEISKDTLEHLYHFYGDKTYVVAKIAKEEGYAEKLDEEYPYIEAEVVYVCRHEMASTLTDVIAARLSIMFLDVNATFRMVPRIVEIMSAELGWDEERKTKEVNDCRVHVKKCTALID